MDAPDGAPEPMWTARRRAGGAYLGVACLFALLVGAAGAGLLRMLLLEPRWPPAIAIGVGLAVVFVATAARGARASVDARGVLRYGWGARSSIEVDLRDVTSVTIVRAGLLRGAGLAVPAERVRFLDKRGPSPRRMREDRARHGVDLVLEFLNDEDARQLEAIREDLAVRAVPPASA